MIIDAFSKKQEDLATVREKIQASREGQVINPAVIAKTPATPAVSYPDKTAATYPDDVAATYPDEMANLSELENQRGTFKWTGRRKIITSGLISGYGRLSTTTRMIKAAGCRPWISRRLPCRTNPRGCHYTSWS